MTPPHTFLVSTKKTANGLTVNFEHICFEVIVVSNLQVPISVNFP